MQVTTTSPPALLEALGNVSRALRAWQFYPTGHPSRKSSILQAHLSLLRALDGNDLSLRCGRTGFSLPNGEILPVHQHFNDYPDNEAILLVFKAKPLFLFMHLLFQKIVSYPPNEASPGHEDFRPPKDL